VLIGITGFKGSGKDTFAERLIEKYDFKKLSFAAKLKESAAKLFDIDIEVWEKLKNDSRASITIKGDYYDNSDRSPDQILVPGFLSTVSARTFLQRYGTEAHRDIFGQDFWVEHAFKGINHLNENFVIPDCRFDNEIDKISSLDGIVVRIIRDGLENNDTHASELPPPANKVDYIVENNGTIQELHQKADEFMEWINKEFDPQLIWENEYEYS